MLEIQINIIKAWQKCYNMQIPSNPHLPRQNKNSENLNTFFFIYFLVPPEKENYFRFISFFPFICFSYFPRNKQQKRERERECVCVYPSDKMRRINKALGAPKRVVEVSPVSFKLRGKAAVNDNAATALPNELGHKRRGLLLRTS